jgi:hypothetical protein
MSICYDLQKWTMVTLANIAISMIVGLVLMQYVYAQSADKFETYTNNDLKFTIEHPSNWKVEDGDDNPTGASFKIRENEKEDVKVNEFFSLPAGFFDSFFSVSVEEPKSDLDTDTMTVQNTSLQERVQGELDLISSNPSEYTLIRQNEVTIGGNTGWKIEYRTTDEYKDRYVSVIFTLAEGKFYILRYVDVPLKVPETLQLVNIMVESFKVNTEDEDEDTGNNSGFEGTGKDSTLEDYQNRCPPMSLVLCRPPPDFEEPQDDSNR